MTVKSERTLIRLDEGWDGVRKKRKRPIKRSRWNPYPNMYPLTKTTSLLHWQNRRYTCFQSSDIYCLWVPCCV